MIYRNYLKRLTDCLVALIAFIFFSPIFLMLTLILGIYFRGNPFYFQKRPGLGGRIFTIVKFRTMLNLTDSGGQLLPDTERLVGLGKLIRKLSLDELPQLLNVIFGQMSLVGPRPLLPEYLALYNEEQSRRHEVRPGITGWAQVNGRNNISWEEKFTLDVWYIENISFKLDIKIIQLTIIKVFLRQGINAPGQVTADYFKGSKQVK